MPVLFTCKFDDDTIKGTENKTYCLIWPKIELVQDDMNLYIRGKKVRDIWVCYVISMNPSEMIM